MKLTAAGCLKSVDTDGVEWIGEHCSGSAELDGHGGDRVLHADGQDDHDSVARHHFEFDLHSGRQSLGMLNNVGISVAQFGF